MVWQLWVPLAVGAIALLIVCVVKFHHASQVFDGLVSGIDQGRADELDQRRRAADLSRPLHRRIRHH